MRNGIQNNSFHGNRWTSRIDAIKNVNGKLERGEEKLEGETDKFSNECFTKLVREEISSEILVDT